MAVFDDSDDISAIGTGSDELCSGRDAVRNLFLRNFAEATASRFEWGWTHTAIEADQAVVATTLTIHLEVDGQSLKVPIRWTVALKRVEDCWLWLHRHASSAAASQDEGSAYPQDA